uniref:PWWP domain-containing protein n=1 Tax=Acrobeloides nanus TaxID=290746 RepID=A0A914E511_9BILA
MKGFPPWPAKIEADSNDSTEIPYGKYRVFFFGTKEIAVMKSSELYHYAERRNDFEVNRKLKGFNEGIDEIRAVAGMNTSSSTSPIRRSARLSHSVEPSNLVGSDESEHPFDEFLLPSLPRRAVSNSNMLSNSERPSGAPSGVDVATSVKIDRKRHASTESNSSRAKRSKQPSTSEKMNDLLDLDPIFGTDPTLPSLMNDAVLDGIEYESHMSRTRRRRTSSRLSTSLGSPMKLRDRSISASSGRVRLLSGFSDAFDDLFEHANVIFNPNELMSAIDMLTNEDSDHAPTPELPSTMSGPPRKCYECGCQCELLNSKWRCTNKHCLKWNGVNEPSLNIDNIPLNTTTTSEQAIEAAASMANDIDQIKQELQADEPSTSFNPVIPTAQHSAMQSMFAFESPSQPKPNEGFYLDSVNNMPTMKLEAPHVEVATASTMNLNLYLEKAKKTGRPKSYKVEKTPPISATGMRHCVFCNGQVRPQMCGGNKHRWRCVDKKCRKWYGWVKSDDEIPKDLGKKGRWRELALRGQNNENDNGENKYSNFLSKTMANRPQSRRSRSKNSLQSKLFSADSNSRQDLTPFERKSRWWINEKYRNDVSPERDFSTAIFDTSATFKLMGTAMLNAATTKISGDPSGYVDLMMDTLMASMGPLLSLANRVLPSAAAPPEVMQKLWKASAVHTPIF